MKELFYNGGEVYVILRRIPQHNILDKNGRVIPQAFNAWKGWLGADKVLKTQTHFLFCETVQSVEWEELVTQTC